MIQLFSSKINVCNTAIIFPRDGVKQGGVLSGILFFSCYDDLANTLSNTGAGVLLNNANHTIQLICVLIYADDIVLVASSPCGLNTLIEQTFSFASTFNDITFNPSKSWILRLGPHRKPSVSVCEIPTSECRKYLGVEIGPKADPERAAAAKLYANANMLLVQNRELKKCSLPVKNVSINCNGNIYALETMPQVSLKLCQAHRYLTKSVHSD